MRKAGGPEPDRRLSWPGRIAFALAVALVAIGTAEGMARVYRALSGAPLRYGYPDDLYVAHPSRGFALRPGYRGAFTGPRYEHVAIETNADGYRDAPPPTAAFRGPRIAVLGDSVTFGSGVEARDRFTDRLAERLQPARVLNLGVNSYTLEHYLDQLRRDVPRYDPRLVLVAFTVNDIARADQSAPQQGARGGGAGGWADRSALLGLVSQLRLSGALALTQSPGERMRSAWEGWERRVAREWQRPEALARLRRELAALAAEAHRQGRLLLVAAMPDRFALADPDTWGLPRRTLLRLLGELGIDAVDLHASFAAAPDPEALFLPADPIHLSAAGHARACQALAPYLEARLRPSDPSTTLKN